MNKKILILEGGYNEEHKVSLKSSFEIQRVLKKNNITFKVLKVNPKNFNKKILRFKNFICFNALHGQFGEDGQIQKILKKNKIKFTHSGIKSSKICFDKMKTKEIIIKKNISTPRFSLIKIKNLNKNELIKISNKYKKFIIKPNKSGSSFGIKIIKSKKDFSNLINSIELFKNKLDQHKEVLIEEYISGKELTVSTISFEKKIEALAVTEIKSKNIYFDYQAKYTKGYSKHILPAKLDKRIYSKCLRLAIKAHSSLNCRSIARTDFIYDTKQKKIYFLEINTQPGLTSISLLPEQAKHKNISFKNVILGILQNTN
tara:strand:- start:714 stop:1658 length:945 start_codon:yes stop_codon:yes gene_type:complete